MNRRINYIDLFSGIGGFALGLKKAGFIFENHWFSEIDKNAINIYKKHFPKAKELGDVRAIRDVSGLRADIITFGFPCQDLSVAGKRAGLAGSRSGLFFEAIRIIREIKPQCFIFENVKGLFTCNRGADFIRCLREIADIGLYDCEWQLVNTSWFLPQNRERVYFIGHLREKSGSKIFPVINSTSKDYQFVNKPQRNLKVHPIIDVTSKNKSQNGRIMGGDKSFTLTTLPHQGILIVPENTKKGFAEIHPWQGVDLTQLSSKTRRGRLMDNNCNTLTTQFCQYAWWDGTKIRRLTPLECERLQGFPDDWTKYGTNGKEMNDSARYKALGNAVSVCWPEWIGQKLLGDGNAE